jgi:flavin-dependent dehydrogenase
MIKNISEIPSDTQLEADICIIGSGAAGLAVALSLAGRGLKIVLLESGTEAFSKKTQKLYAGELADEKLHSPPDKYRHRRFGGSTSI